MLAKNGSLEPTVSGDQGYADLVFKMFGLTCQPVGLNLKNVV